MLTPEAASVLQSFYLTLRQTHGDEETTPVTARQLESLVRLSQARAKVELREEVTKQDAEDVVLLFRKSLMDVAVDEFGVCDFTRAHSGMSRGKQVKTLVSALQKEAQRKGGAMFTMNDIKDIAVRIKLSAPSLEDLVDVLRQQNYLLKKGRGLYALISSNYSQF